MTLGSLHDLLLILNYLLFYKKMTINQIYSYYLTNKLTNNLRTISRFWRKSALQGTLI